MRECGFTLLEVLVALAIAATSLVVLMGRLGTAADIQHSLFIHATSLDVAYDLLERGRLRTGIAMHEESGTVTSGKIDVHWRITAKKAGVPDFVRQEVTASVREEPGVELFLYRAVP